MARWFAKGIPFIRSVGLGAAAYVVGYLVTFGWLGSRSAQIASDVTVTLMYGSSNGAVTSLLASHLEQFGGISATTWSGWLFYNAHFVPLSLSVEGPGARGSMPNILLAADAPFLPVLFVIPPLLLLAAGFVSVRLKRAPAIPGLLPRGASPGMAIIAGYLPLTLVGAGAFAVSQPMEYSGVSPDLLMSVLLMGVIYPVVFGGLGGWLGIRVRGAANRARSAGTDYSPR